MRGLSKLASALLTVAIAGCATADQRPDQSQSADIFEGTQSVGLADGPNPVRVAERDASPVTSGGQASDDSPATLEPTFAGQLAPGETFDPAPSSQPLSGQTSAESRASHLPLLPDGLLAQTTGSTETEVRAERRVLHWRPTPDRSNAGDGEVHLAAAVSEARSTPQAATEPARAGPDLTVSPMPELEDSPATKTEQDRRPDIPPVPPKVSPQSSVVAGAFRQTAGNITSGNSGPVPVTATVSAAIAFRGAIRSADGGMVAQLHSDKLGSLTVRTGDLIPITRQGGEEHYLVQQITDSSVLLAGPHDTILAK